MEIQQLEAIIKRLGNQNAQLTINLAVAETTIEMASARVQELEAQLAAKDEG